MPTSDTPASDVHPRTDSSMLELMGRGVAEALRKHQEQGVPVVTWDRETRQTVIIPADQIAAWLQRTNIGPDN